ncbi:4a-hydroxytetrahydrobiopterin dehydratase [Herbaspirillum sp. BH-1]|uniref:Putative pterin-4-alpha-carbinolamine dehydratase n=1 Tax=Herbaspirillum frisingense TaxID=92645 RepID=A0ABU1PIP0_9BURK|nr:MULTISPECIES: 4a-hydroxytetrahydrobiopterin dehydratase [Herbaspirillum]MDR6585781.1 4a-hydroxytetrahydrobiopterin dehydratase [Herbaspirillum frisingense]PLY61306.1 4a-hydroxytetrahydrobiopterin dehydratase [Herbaspirillum sp. BH-1]
MSITASTLAASRCVQPIEALDDAALASHLAALPEWKIEGGKLARSFAFANYYETLAFVNAIAWVIHAEDHHPDLGVSYNRCSVRFDTHSVNDGRGGLSTNDFVCAAKVDAIFAQRANA